MLIDLYMEFIKMFLPPKKSNIIYKFSCHYGSDYVGKTSKRFHVRIDQHVLKSWKAGLMVIRRNLYINIFMQSHNIVWQSWVCEKYKITEPFSFSESGELFLAAYSGSPMYSIFKVQFMQAEKVRLPNKTF